MYISIHEKKMFIKKKLKKIQFSTSTDTQNQAGKKKPTKNSQTKKTSSDQFKLF